MDKDKDILECPFGISFSKARAEAGEVWEFRYTTIPNGIHVSIASDWRDNCTVTFNKDKVFWLVFSGEKAYSGVCSVNDAIPDRLREHIQYLGAKNESS